jgi:hypothetical protein
VPRTFPPAPGWSANGHRIKAPMDYGRGLEKVGVYGGLRVRAGQEVTFTAPSRNTVGYRKLLKQIDEANPDGGLNLVSDHLSSHTSGLIQEWLTQHPRVHPVPSPPPHRRLLAQPPGRLVAALPSRGVCRPILR